MQDAVCLFDAPSVLDCSVTPIPRSSDPPLQVVASVPAFITEIQVCDGVGEYVGLYLGPPGQEVLRAVIGSGTLYTLPLVVQKGTRVSLRSMDDSEITRGTLCVCFIGSFFR